MISGQHWDTRRGSHTRDLGVRASYRVVLNILLVVEMTTSLESIIYLSQKK